jgi:AmmeMemoRadiSam system protein B
MIAAERPQVHPYLSAAPDHRDPRFFLVWDRLGIGKGPQRLNQIEFACLRLFDGRRTLRDVQAETLRVSPGVELPLEWLARLVERMEAALLLEGPRFRERLAEHLAGPVREPRCIGCYEGEPDALRRQLRGLFTGPKGPGMPGQRKADGKLRAALIPHMDYTRGGHTFAWGFKELYEHTEASLFVIIATSHYSPHRYTLTRKDFRTPLGIARTDQEYIDRLIRHYGDGLFDDEPCHLPEHSIELEVVFLQYLYEGQPFRIVPLLVGPFQDSVFAGSEPRFRDDVGRMIEALRRAEEETPEPVCYVISGDLAHIGPKFGDPQPVREPMLEHSRQQDQAILRQAESADAAGFFRVIADEGDCRRICGLPPTYTALAAARPGRGKVLHYDQYVHPHGHESVSFASVAFYR